MYVSVSRLRIEQENAPDLVKAFNARAHLVDACDGFISLEVWQAEGDSGEIMMVSHWRDRDAFKAYMRSAEHRTSHDRIEPALKDAITLERLEHLTTYEVVST